MSDVPSDSYDCVPCKTDGHHIDAKHFCKQCKEHLCNACRDQHRKSKGLRDHVIVKVSLADVPESVQSASDESYDCDTCKQEGHMIKAQHYCEHCEEYLCSTCRNQHGKFKMSRDHKILSGSLLPKRPVSKRATTFGVLQVHDISNLTVKSASKVNVKLSGDDETPRIIGCTFMPGGQLLICDFMNNNLKLFDRTLAIKESLNLSSYPWDVAVIDDTTAVVTLPYKQMLMYIVVTPKLSKGSTISLDRNCYGVAVAGNEIYVSCHDGPESTTGDVRVLDIRGSEKRKIDVYKDGSFMFKKPFYVAADSNGNRIYLSDFKRSAITCLKTNGDDVYRYKDNDLVGPHGLYVDSKGNLIVCSKTTNSLQVITAAGTKHKKALICRDGVKKPLAVDFRPNDGTLVVGCMDQNELCVFKLA